MKRHPNNYMFVILIMFSCSFCQAQQNSTGDLFKYDPSAQTRWSSPENINGKKGNGGKENSGAKGKPSVSVPAGQTFDLLNITDQGIINRIWLTVDDRSPKTLRSLVLEMFWDGAEKPAVAVPLADFFGMGLGKVSSFNNALFANPEGRSFSCFIKMPFKKGVRICIKNESGNDLGHLFFDVDYSLLKNWDDNNLYFHAWWHRDTATVLGKDYEILSYVKGHGRLLGLNAGINANPTYGMAWWGEGEVKIYLDGDQANPTLVGTGSEDYISDGWGQNKFVNPYSGCLIADDKNLQWTFYRYHVPDPIYFHQDCRVTIQQIGSALKKDVLQLQQKGVAMIPTTIDDGHGKITYLFKKQSKFDDTNPTSDYALFYRSDDISSTVYFYLDSPVSDLPPLQSLSVRTANLKAEVK